jgi:hypothetical protein
MARTVLHEGDAGRPNRQGGPEPLRAEATAEIELEKLRTPDGIRFEGKRLVAVAQKPASH